MCSSAVPLVAGRAMETARLNDTGNRHADTANYLIRRGSHRSGLLIWHLNRGRNTVALSRVAASETPKAR
jgi:hypothetical protein